MPDKACRKCRRLTKSNLCPICKSTDVTKSWRGIIVVMNADSEIAREVGITTPGKYAVRVK